MGESKKTYSVYVIELDQEGLARPGEAGAVYVGETELTPEQRFAKHMAGGKSASKHVTRRGLRLRPDLYPPESPFESRAQAQKYERKTGNRLRARGYRVFGAQGKPFMKHESKPSKGEVQT